MIALLVMVVACAYHPYHFIITVVMGKWKGGRGRGPGETPGLGREVTTGRGRGHGRRLGVEGGRQCSPWCSC